MAQLPAEHSESVTRYLLKATRKGLDPLARALELVPDGRLAEEPVPSQLPVGKMIEHAFGAVAFSARAIRLGRCEKEDMADLLQDDEQTGTRPRIRRMREVATAEIEQALSALSPEVASHAIPFWFGQTMTGPDVAILAFQELCHHRGQVQSFLRLMGYDPPDIYQSGGPAPDDES